VFEALKAEAIAAFDRIIGLDLTEVSVDGSLHKAPYGGEGTGPVDEASLTNPVTRQRWRVSLDHVNTRVESVTEGIHAGSDVDPDDDPEPPLRLVQ